MAILDKLKNGQIMLKTKNITIVLIMILKVCLNQANEHIAA